MYVDCSNGFILFTNICALLLINFNTLYMYEYIHNVSKLMSGGVYNMSCKNGCYFMILHPKHSYSHLLYRKSHERNFIVSYSKMKGQINVILHISNYNICKKQN